jgi:hypothetical protein
MKPLLIYAASALALGLAACGPQTPKTRAALDCPARQGDLTRTSASPDGKACTYTNADGAEVTLQLVALQGGVDQTLSAIETSLLANRVKGEPAKGEPDKAADKAAAGDAAAKAAQEASADAAATSVRVEGKHGDVVDSGPDGVHVKDRHGASVDVDVKGVDVDVKGNGHGVTEGSDGTTHVNLPGIHITANDKDDTANVQVGPLHIDAGGDAATIRMRQDVRLRGEPLNPERRGFRAMWLYKGDDLPDGLKFVGYEAGGPKTGPITVAVVKSKEHADDDIYGDVKRLVRKNGGV